MDKIIKEDFLMISLFGAKYQVNTINAAINRAYRDFCRTIRVNSINSKLDLDDKNENNSKAQASKVIHDFIKSKDLANYNIQHHELCDKLHEIGYTYGQAQKWVNMTMKYLMILDYELDANTVKQLHIPLDKKILNYAYNKHWFTPQILGDYTSWSELDDYVIYNNIQELIRNKIEGRVPINWEFEIWNKLP